MWFHFLCLVAVTASAEEPLYKKIGNTVVLTPDSVEKPITDIIWMHGNHVAMEWHRYRYGDKPLFFGRFKARGSLNILTGEMMIRGLTRDYSGIYTAEINDKETSKTELLVISPVPEPVLYVLCDPEKTYCVYTCDGSTTDAEPVTYWWTAGGKRWNSTNQHKITKEDKEQWFSCELKNPVSSSSSEKVFNPFKEEEPLYKKIGNTVVLTPDSVEKPITDIIWMYGNDVAIEWHRYRYGDKPSFFGRFEARGSLNISTGVMTITGLTRDHSGIYTAEINNKINGKTELLVISPVPEPVLYVLCDPEKTYCVYTCDGNTTGTEPVTYWWTAGGKRWNSTKELKITKEDKEQWFSCELKNPVSSSSSEKVFNPFKEADNTWKLIYLIIPISLAGLIIAVYFRHKYRKSFRPQWQYVRLSKGWWDFRKTTDPPNICSVTSDDIESWYQKTPQDKMPFTVKGDPYELDFDEMIQTNLKDSNKRKVRRVMVPPEYKAVFCPHCV